MATGARLRAGHDRIRHHRHGVLPDHVRHHSRTHRADARADGGVLQDLSDLLHNRPWQVMLALTVLVFINLALKGGTYTITSSTT